MERKIFFAITIACASHVMRTQINLSGKQGFNTVFTVLLMLRHFFLDEIILCDDDEIYPERQQRDYHN